LIHRRHDARITSLSVFILQIISSSFLQAADANFKNCGIQNSRFTLVHNPELYDLKIDPGETTMETWRQPAQGKATALECDKMNPAAVRFHRTHVVPSGLVGPATLQYAK
jgi:hypothetical protein